MGQSTHGSSSNSRVVFQNDNTAILVAAECGNTYALHKLRSHGANPRALNLHGHDVVILAAIGGHEAFLADVLDWGKPPKLRQYAKPWTKNSRCGTVVLDMPARRSPHALLGCACSDRTPVVVHTERLDVPSLKVKSIVTGNTALIEAAAHGHAAAVDILLAAEVDVNIKNRAGFSALMCAAMHGHLAVLQRMVAWRRSPFARLHNRAKAVSPADLDKSLGIDLNETCRVRWKVAMQWCGTFMTLTVSMWKQTGDTALTLACRFGHIDAVELLLSKGCDINVQNRTGMSAVMWACKGQHVEVVEALMRRFAETNHEEVEKVGMPDANTAGLRR